MRVAKLDPTTLSDQRKQPIDLREVAAVTCVGSCSEKRIQRRMPIALGFSGAKNLSADPQRQRRVAVLKGVQRRLRLPIAQINVAVPWHGQRQGVIGRCAERPHHAH
jgi:hypothetical protein